MFNYRYLIILHLPIAQMLYPKSNTSSARKKTTIRCYTNGCFQYIFLQNIKHTQLNMNWKIFESLFYHRSPAKQHYFIRYFHYLNWSKKKHREKYVRIHIIIFNWVDRDFCISILTAAVILITAPFLIPHAAYQIQTTILLTLSSRAFKSIELGLVHAV